MKFQVIYGFECNPHEIIKDFLNEEADDTKPISTGDSDDKKRPTVEMTLVTFDNKDDAIRFIEYYSQHCCHTMLKDGCKTEGKNGPYPSYVTIQDYHLYEWLHIKEIED